MPFISSSGGTGPVRPRPHRRPAASGRPAVTVRTYAPRAGAGAATCRRHRCRARRPAPPASPPSVVGAGHLLAGALAQPGHVVRPPGALHRLGLRQPLLRVGGRRLRDLERGLRVARRVDQRGDVAAGRQDEPALPAEQLGGAVAGLPRAEVVGDPGGDVGVDGDRGQVDRGPEHRRLARLGQRVADRDVDEVAVQRRAHPGGVGVPEEDVEVRRRLALQVVVDPVVPHEVVGPQPGEDLGAAAAPSR